VIVVSAMKRRVAKLRRRPTPYVEIRSRLVRLTEPGTMPVVVVVVVAAADAGALLIVALGGWVAEVVARGPGAPAGAPVGAATASVAGNDRPILGSPVEALRAAAGRIRTTIRAATAQARARRRGRNIGSMLRPSAGSVDRDRSFPPRGPAPVLPTRRQMLRYRTPREFVFRAANSSEFGFRNRSIRAPAHGWWVDCRS